MAKKEIIRYIEPQDNGKPAQSLTMLLEELKDTVEHTIWCDSTITKYAGKNRRKIRITIKVEAY